MFPKYILFECTLVIFLIKLSISKFGIYRINVLINLAEISIIMEIYKINEKFFLR